MIFLPRLSNHDIRDGPLITVARIESRRAHGGNGIAFFHRLIRHREFVTNEARRFNSATELSFLRLANAVARYCIYVYMYNTYIERTYCRMVARYKVFLAAQMRRKNPIRPYEYSVAINKIMRVLSIPATEGSLYARCM